MKTQLNALWRNLVVPCAVMVVTVVAGLATLPAFGAEPPTVHAYASGAGGIFANAYLVETAHGVVAIDATLTRSDSQALRARLEALHKPLRAVLLTHGHPDHYNGVTTLVAGARVPVISTAEVLRIIRRDDARKEAQWKPVFKDEWPSPRTFPNQTLASGRSVTIDGVRFTVQALGPGESDGDSIWLAEAPGWSAAFIGDVVLDGVHAYLSDGHSTAWLKNIERVRGLTRQAGMLYPGHGAAGGPELLDAQRDYLLAYRQQVQQLAAGRPQLDDAQKDQLEAAMRQLLKSDRLQFLVKLGADPVAAELAREGARP